MKNNFITEELRKLGFEQFNSCLVRNIAYQIVMWCCGSSMTQKKKNYKITSLYVCGWSPHHRGSSKNQYNVFSIMLKCVSLCVRVHATSEISSAHQRPKMLGISVFQVVSLTHSAGRKSVTMMPGAVSVIRVVSGGSAICSHREKYV